MYRGIVLDSGWDIGGWRQFPEYYLVDLVFNWVAFFLGGVFLGTDTRSQFLFGMYAMPLVWFVISALGWTRVCRLVWGGGNSREVTVILGHALPFLVFALGEEYFFAVMFLQVNHVSSWAVMPWVLLAWLKVLETRTQGGGTHWKWLTIATMTMFIVTFSDFAIVAWFTIPTMMALGLAVLFSRPRSKSNLTVRRNWRFVLLKLWMPMILGTVAGNYLSETILKVSVDANFGNILVALKTFSSYLVKAWHYTPVLSFFWCVFVMCSVGYLLYRIYNWLRLEELFLPQAASKELPTVNKLFQVLMPLWLTGAVSGTMVGGIVGGLADPLHAILHWGTELRYYLPAFWLPVVVGGALLPWHAPKRWIAGTSGLVAMACIALIGLRPFDTARLNPFNNEFHECVVGLANEQGWEGGMGSYWYTWLLADPQLPLHRYLLAANVKDDDLVVSATNGHTSWGTGRMDFFVITEVDPVDTIFPPLDPQAQVCNGIRREKCMDTRIRIEERVVKKFANDDYGVVKCGDVKLAVFNSPKHLNAKFS